MSQLLYVIAGLLTLVLALVGIDLYQRHSIVATKVGQASAVAVNTIEIKEAHDDNTAELEALRAYHDSHPDIPFRLCNPVLQAASKAKAGPGARAAVVQPVHDPDPVVRPAGDPPDIGRLLGAFAAFSDSVSAKLREQQAVH